MDMSGASRRSSTGQQVNFTLDPHWRLVLRMTAEADGVSVPDLLRPVVMRYLRGRMRNEDLQEAVARIELVRRSRRAVPDNVTLIPKSSKSSRSPQKRIPSQGDSVGRRRPSAVSETIKEPPQTRGPAASSPD